MGSQKEDRIVQTSVLTSLPFCAVEGKVWEEEEGWRCSDLV